MHAYIIWFPFIIVKIILFFKHIFHILNRIKGTAARKHHRCKGQLVCVKTEGGRLGNVKVKD